MSKARTSFLFRRLDISKSNRNLRNDKLDYSHLTKFENAGYQDLIADKRKAFLVHFQPNYGWVRILTVSPSRLFFRNKVLGISA